VARKKIKLEGQSSSSAGIEQQSQVDLIDDRPPPALRELMTRRVLLPLVNYALLAFIEQCCSVLMPLVYATSIPYGGLNLSSFTIGVVMSALGIALGISSAIFFPILLRAIGIYRLYRAALRFYIVIIASFPIMNLLARRAGQVDGCGWAILVVQLVCSTVSIMTFSESRE
jgi:hypothetical protein